MRREHNDRAWLAWHVAALPKSRRFPKLDALTIKDQGKPKPEDPGERVTRMSAIAAMWHDQAQQIKRR